MPTIRETPDITRLRRRIEEDEAAAQEPNSAETGMICPRCGHNVGIYMAFDYLCCEKCGTRMEDARGQPPEAIKHDSEKLPLHLLPFDALEEVARTLGHGADKHSPHGWRDASLPWSYHFSAALRHLWSWFLRRGVDKESGRTHLAHAACRILFLITYELRNAGQDDRP